MSSGTEPRILCYVTDRLGLARGAVPADESVRVARLLAQIRMAIEAGVDWVQIREKDLAGRPLMDLTRQALALALASAADATTVAKPARIAPASQRRSRVIVNDRLDVAVAAEAGGVHLGGESLPVREAAGWRAKERGTRAELANFLIGASCHSVQSAQAAAAAGADYIIFGPVFDTPSKAKFGAPQGVERLREVCAAVQIPVLAIGGIDASNAAECFGAGASGVAAIRLFQEANSVHELKARAAAIR